MHESLFTQRTTDTFISIFVGFFDLFFLKKAKKNEIKKFQNSKISGSR